MITETGTRGQSNSTLNSDATGFNITVPSDAEIVLVGVVGYDDLGPTVNFFSGGSCSVGGQAMTAIAADGDTTFMQGCLFYLLAPPTGTQAVTWNWVGANNAGHGVLFGYTFWKGLRTAQAGGAVRFTDGIQQGANPHTSNSLTAGPGDKIIGWAFSFISTENTWTVGAGTTLLAQLTNANGTDAVWVTADPSKAQTISASGSESLDGGIASIVLSQPFAARGPNPLRPAIFSPGRGR